MLLAIDTATRVLSLALYDGAEVRAELTWSTPNQHTVELMPSIQLMLEKAKITVAELSAIAISQGPGSFNGLRIGFSAAKGLALACELPLIAIPTLAIIAAAQPSFDGLLICVIQIGRGRICMESYRWQATHWISLDDTRILTWQALLDSVEMPTIITGEIDSAGRDSINQEIQAGKPIQIGSAALALRRAGFLAELAWQRWQADQAFYDFKNITQAVPLYLHQPGVNHP